MDLDSNSLGDPNASARNLYEEGFLVASKGVQAAGETMPTLPPPVDPDDTSAPPNNVDNRSAYFVEPIVRDGR